MNKISDSSQGMLETQNKCADKKDNSTYLKEDEITNLFEKCTFKDPYQNCIIDLSASDWANQKEIQKNVNKTFSELSENKEGYQHLIVKISQKQTRVYKYLINHEFKVHHSEDNVFLLKRCLGDQGSECVYPPYKTMSIGITVVIFSHDLTQFLAVQEKTGPYRGWKAPTGSVDYEKEDELQASVRELQEETNLKVLPEQLSLVAMAPTNNLRGRSPDRNFVYTCKINSNNEIKPQEKEIKQVAWISVSDFLNSKLPVSHELRPLILQEVVRVAKETLEKNMGWKPGLAYWGSGRPAILYQQLP